MSFAHRFASPLQADAGRNGLRRHDGKWDHSATPRTSAEANENPRPNPPVQIPLRGPAKKIMLISLLLLATLTLFAGGLLAQNAVKQQPATTSPALPPEEALK